MSHHPDHPCGAVPVSQWHVTVWYCHTHEAYFAASGALRDVMDGDLGGKHKWTSVEFGPFDTATDVQHWVQSQLPGVRKLLNPVKP